MCVKILTCSGCEEEEEWKNKIEIKNALLSKSPSDEDEEQLSFISINLSFPKL